ncbi:hypothetical protein O3M35_008475 [Rhynocoris fuscipes]|uniref:Uncharacterized protein n=1 Tax=Rhynocoris fuscipes TaxID=488301 RepID=A0AAW1D6F8_9HEMI
MKNLLILLTIFGLFSSAYMANVAFNCVPNICQQIRVNCYRSAFEPCYDSLECTPTICKDIKVKCNSAEYQPCHGHIERHGGGLCGCCPICISNQDQKEGQSIQ